VEGNTSKENLKNCRVQGKYAGTVEDKVSFVVTHIDEDRNVAVGIIKQNSL
jgi:small subunit ribosomal protein S1